MGFSVTLEIAATIGVLIALRGLGKTISDWKNEKACAHADVLDSLLQRIENNRIFQKLRLSNDGENALGAMDNDNDCNDFASLLQTYDYICYLREHNLITDDELIFFKSHLEKTFKDKSVIAYVQDNKANTLELYHYLKDYITKNGFNLSIVDEEASNVNEDPISSTVVLEGVEEISEADFNEPTMVIKINRRYREGMNKDELYETTRQWWAVRLTSVQRMKYALAVVNGRVLEVYKIDSWEKDEDVHEEHGGRYRFTGSVATGTKRSKFVGKSVKSLFVKGAANPIRYFG